MKNDMIVNRQALLEGERKTVESLWEDIERFIMPFRGEFFRDLKCEGEVNWRKRHIYDSTAIQAAQNLAASVQSNLMNPSTRWFNFMFRDKELQSEDEAREWLETCADVVYYALSESDFNKEAAESITDMVGFGTSIIIEEENDGLDFSSIPIREAYFEEDVEGGIINLYRILRWTPDQCEDFFVKGDYKRTDLPKEILEKLDTKESGTLKFDIIFCVYRRPLISKKITPPISATLRPYGSKYVMKASKLTIGVEGGYYEMPAFCPRWRTTSGSRWGHSPSVIALPDVMTLNEVVETTLEVAAKVIDPPLITTQRGIMSDVQLGRGGLTVLRDMDSLAPFNTGGRLDLGKLEIQRLQESIKESFFVNQLELKDSPAMTATEAQIRYELMQRLLGPTVGRMQSDFLGPMLSRTFNIEARAGRLPPPPQIVIDANAEYDVEYTGPAARSHKQEEIISTQRWLQSLAEYAQVDPSVLDVVDTINMPQQMGIRGGVPAIMMRSNDQIEAIRKDREQQQKDASAAMQTEQDGKAMEAMGKGQEALKVVK